MERARIVSGGLRGLVLDCDPREVSHTVSDSVQVHVSRRMLEPTECRRS